MPAPRDSAMSGRPRDKTACPTVGQTSSSTTPNRDRMTPMCITTPTANTPGWRLTDSLCLGAIATVKL